ncbi:hypothetical protein M407DRAFT_242543 [Tulasnella calospora MUT 4182]|uniref:Uncharacterized protein n=1 Tax=Tulasnella calospora MUT 4182 TaxID=1051891 RepID=A0A0C3QQ95_9AGAM|nr:hypothetical protein M407DRAFT_242543 [Tulasnella calospora MUT 4182]
MWYWIQGHCLISLLLGCFCIFLQIVLYTWLNESQTVFVVTVFVAAWCLLPLVFSLSDSIHSARNVREIRPS